jgi:hypothetical protein
VFERNEMDRVESFRLSRGEGRDVSRARSHNGAG